MKSFVLGHKMSISALTIFLICLVAYFVAPRSNTYDAHATHKQMIADRLANRGVPEMDLDIVFDRPKTLLSGQEIKLSWKIFDAESGAPVTKFDRNMEKLLHLIVVNDSLDYFDHVHPEFDGQSFSLSYTFPKDDAYRMYLDFQPTGSQEIQKDFRIVVGRLVDNVQKEFSADLSKTFGDYTVSLSSTFKARDIVTAKSHFIFTVSDAKTGKPVKDLRPHLGAFGHLVMIKADDYSYIHVHPLNYDLTDDRSGPTVEFLPLDLKTGSLEPGRYRLFAQFNPTSGLFTADFTVDIK